MKSPARAAMNAGTAIVLTIVATAYPLWAAATPHSATTTTAPSHIPLLPLAVHKKIRQAQTMIRAAWASPEDAAILAKALPLAEAALADRLKYQPAEWWESVEAQLALAGLRQLSAMSTDQRHALAGTLALQQQLRQMVNSRDFSHAADVGRKVVAQLQQLLGPDHLRVADALDDACKQLSTFLPPAEQLADARNVLRIRQAAFTGDAPDVADSLSLVAHLLAEAGQPVTAADFASQALAMDRRLAADADDPDVVHALRLLAFCQLRAGEPTHALDTMQQALEMNQRLYAGDNGLTADLLADTADCDRTLGRLDQAIAGYQEAMAMDQRLDPRHRPPMAVFDLIGIGTCEQQEGRADAAAQAYRQAAAAAGALTPAEPRTQAAALDALARFLQDQGVLDEALSDFQHAVALRDDDAHEDDAGLATALNNLGACLQALGNTADALMKFQRALAVRKSIGASPNLPLADASSNVAYCQRILLGPQAGLPGFLDALQMYRQLRPPVPDRIATTLNNIAYCEQLLGKYDQAIGHFQQALDGRRALGGSNALDVAEATNNLASCLSAAGRPAMAMPLFRQALTMRQQLFQGDHPDIAATMSGLGAAQAALGQWDDADASLLDAERMKWSCLTRTFPVLSDGQKPQYLAHASFGEGQRLSDIAVQGHASPATGMTAVLLEKHLLFEVARQEQRVLDADAAAGADDPRQWARDYALRQQLRKRYATLALATSHVGAASAAAPADGAAGDAQSLHVLADQVESVEQRLRETNPHYAQAARLEQVAMSDVAAALKPDEAVVEYTQFSPTSPATAAASSTQPTTMPAPPPHYAAFVLRGRDQQAAVFDLGEVKAIDAMVDHFREPVLTYIGELHSGMNNKRRLTNDSRAFDTASPALAAAVWKPIEPALANVRRVYVAPEGKLSLFPFEALEVGNTADGPRFLVEDREIVYLNTGRDLARLAATATPTRTGARTAVLIGAAHFRVPPRTLANIVFHRPPATTMPATAVAASPPTQPATLPAAPTLGSADDRQFIPRNWGEPPALAELIDAAAKQLRALGWSVTTLTGDHATEEAAESLHAPTILQFATHGYMMDKPAVDRGWDNPLLQSMLMLAGESTWTGGDEDRFVLVGNEVLTHAQARERGIPDDQFNANATLLADGCLNAYEVSGIDLHGTELVNLTACETALGTVTPQGVAGLRQGFLLAGARSLTMSMWEIDAVEAPAQAQNFYRRWLGDAQHAGTPRYAAFREAELDALAAARAAGPHAFPFMWAGVVYIGDPGDLQSVGSTAPSTTATRN